MDILDALLGGQQNAYPVSTPTAQAPTLNPSPGASASPSILDMMAATASAPPQLPKADTSSLLPLTLLNFAANVSQPRQRGQSVMGKTLESLGGAATFNMNTKRQLEDQAVTDELNRRRIAATDAALEGAKLGNIKTRQGIIAEEETRPLELQKLQLAITNAKSDQEIKQLEIKVKAVQSKYADQMAQAKLDETNATSDDKRAEAAMKRSHAELYKRQADDFLEAIKLKAQGANRPDFQKMEGLPGEPTKFFDKRDPSRFYYGPMEPAEALSQAKRQVAAMKEIGEIKTSDEVKTKTNELYQTYLKGTIPSVGSEGGTPPAGATPAPGAPAKPGAESPLVVEAKNASIKDSRGVFAADVPGVGTRYFIGGKEVSKTEALARVKKPGAQPAPASAPAGAPPLSDEVRASMGYRGVDAGL